MWKCANCSSLSEAQTETCAQCGAFRSVRWCGPVTAVAERASCPPKRTRGGLITARQLAQAHMASLPLSAGWRTFLGPLAPEFAMLVYGPPGQGKSTYLLMFAQELARIGEVLFVAAEEGQGTTTIEKLNRLEIHSDRIHISSSVSLPELEQDLDQVNGAKFLVIDSLAAFPVSLVQLSELTEARRLGVAFSAHASKDRKTYRGSADWSHWCDVVVRAAEGNLFVEKNRYGPLTQGQLTWNRAQESVHL